MSETSALNALAEIVHRQHLIASRASTWRECQMLLCYQARRIEASHEVTQVTPL